MRLPRKLSKPLRDARVEVAKTADWRIDYETGLKWAARAIAAYEQAKRAKSHTERIEWFVRASDYRHEGLEHAAQSRDYGKLVGTLQRVLDKYEREVERLLAK